jgi:2-polyprenyl-6-methoxyphenol hydroxylase-like FAD-dependent oxidoreductase
VNYVTHHFDTEVVICGAGPAGLTLAIDLARRGVSFMLIEQVAVPFQGSKGKGIQPRTLEIFADLEVVDRLIAAGGPYPLVREYNIDGSVSDIVMMKPSERTLSEPFNLPHMLPQFMTEGILRDRLAELGHRPLFSHAMISFEQDEASVAVDIDAPDGARSIRAKYLVGADGGRSAIREKFLGIGFPGRNLDVRAVVADIALEGLTRDRWHQFKADQGAVNLCPLMGTDMFQLQVSVPLEGDVDLTLEGVQALIFERSGRADITVTDIFWASLYSMSARLADHYRVGRVFIAGDAAHIHPPTGAQGLNTSVQDAYNLGWKLGAVLSGAPEALLGSYEQERRPIAAGMLNLSTGLLGETLGGTLRRDRTMQQLDLGYAESWVSMLHSSETKGVFAGDRAPDAPVLLASGDRSRLFDLFRGPQWTLLGIEVGKPPIASRRGLRVYSIGYDVLDPEGHIRTTYGLLKGDWVLVRPDGYIAAVIEADQLSLLESYLDRFGLVTPL